ncbi:MAG TPA: hypothetical protein VHM25_24530 [Polyangiaceae bacterium]|jgi:hypothetical protein|nr:hypothetical protein [Polyangiaceae bacterium]
MAHSGRASAQAAAPIELEWSAVEGCPSADTVLARVRKIAGTTRATANTLRAQATVTQPNDGLFRLRLEIHYGNLSAVRTIDGKSCKDLAGATAVALALLLSSEEPLSERDLAGTLATGTGADLSGGDPQSDTHSTEPTQPATPPKPITRPPPPTAPPSVQPDDAGAPRRWRVLLAAPLGSLAVGPMPQVSLGAGVGLGFSFDRWHVLAEGKLWASQHETASHVGEASDVKLSRFSVGARGCRFIWGSRFEVAPCALVTVHHLAVLGSGQALEPSGPQSVTWASVGIGAQSRLLLAPWFGLVAAVDGEVQLSRPEVSVSPPPESQLVTPEQIVRLAPVGATLTVGGEWIF